MHRILTGAFLYFVVFFHNSITNQRKMEEIKRVMLMHDELTGMLVWLDDSKKGCNAMGYYVTPGYFVTSKGEDKGGMITERLVKLNLKPEDYKYAGKIYKIEI